jgi:hypothetical protein
MYQILKVVWLASSGETSSFFCGVRIAHIV